MHVNECIGFKAVNRSLIVRNSEIRTFVAFLSKILFHKADNTMVRYI